MPRVRASCIALVALALSACGEQRAPSWELTGSTMGTTFSVVVVSPSEAAVAATVETRIHEALDEVDRLASTWRADSELSAFNAQESTDWLPVSAAFCDMLEQALDVARETGGAFDVTVGPLVNLWGFGPGRIVSEPPADELLEAARQLVGFEGIATDCTLPAVRKRDAGMYVDLSGWAKGYAVDQVAQLLADDGLADVMVEIGGELRVGGHTAEGRNWAIAVEAPATDRRVAQRVVRVTDTSVATSGDYRNYFEFEGRMYSHTIDPRTGRPVAHGLASVTVVDNSAARADALATALLVLGPEDGPALAESLGVAAYFLVRDTDAIREKTTTGFDRLRE